MPLVFVFHGGNGTAAGTMERSRFNAVSEREKFLVVHPQGIGRGWSDGRAAGVSQAHRENVDDLAFFDALLAHLSRLSRVDPKRVFASGLSNGAMFSHHLAVNGADSIAAIAPIGEGIVQPLEQKCHPAVPVSVFNIQGTADLLVPYAGSRIAGGDGKDRGSVIATDAALQLWVQGNGCQPIPETSCAA